MVTLKDGSRHERRDLCRVIKENPISDKQLERMGKSREAYETDGKLPPPGTY